AEVENDYSAEFDRERVSAIRLSLANVEEQLGNLEAAEEQMRLILDEFPDDITAKNTLAYFWACAKTNLNLALRYSKETREEEPENPMFQDTMGWICFQLGNFEKAKEFLLNAEKTLEDPVVFSHLGDVFLALNQKDEAEKYFQKALELFQKAQRKKESIILKDLKHVEDQLKILKNS
ncbi:MAG: tetratricopeptide repeat protein, partial [Planctomycetia bacterium]|nr:tetratricopeptide repeat protein [Planctomycetia bacterium]